LGFVAFLGGALVTRVAGALLLFFKLARNSSMMSMTLPLVREAITKDELENIALESFACLDAALGHPRLPSVDVARDNLQRLASRRSL
jgi:hypothetical protein